MRRASARDRAQLGAARAIGDAARLSVDAVRAQLAGAARTLVPAVDAVLVYEEHDGELRCVAAFGERTAYFADSRVALDATEPLPVRALRAGHRVTLDDGARPMLPSDVAAIAVPLGLDAGRRACAVLSARTALDANAVEHLALLVDQCCAVVCAGARP